MGPMNDDDKMVTSTRADTPVRSDVAVPDPVAERDVDANQADELIAPGFVGIEEAGYGHGV